MQKKGAQKKHGKRKLSKKRGKKQRKMWQDRIEPTIFCLINQCMTEKKIPHFKYLAAYIWRYTGEISACSFFFFFLSYLFLLAALYEYVDWLAGSLFSTILCGKCYIRRAFGFSFFFFLFYIAVHLLIIPLFCFIIFSGGGRGL